MTHKTGTLQTEGEKQSWGCHLWPEEQTVRSLRSSSPKNAETARLVPEVPATQQCLGMERGAHGEGEGQRRMVKPAGAGPGGERSQLLPKCPPGGRSQDQPSPEGRQVLCVSHGGSRPPSESHVDVEAHASARAHLHRGETCML